MPSRLTAQAIRRVKKQPQPESPADLSVPYQPESQPSCRRQSLEEKRTQAIRTAGPGETKSRFWTFILSPVSSSLFPSDCDILLFLIDEKSRFIHLPRKTRRKSARLS